MKKATPPKRMIGTTARESSAVRLWLAQTVEAAATHSGLRNLHLRPHHYLSRADRGPVRRRERGGGFEDEVCRRRGAGENHNIAVANHGEARDWHDRRQHRSRII